MPQSVFSRPDFFEVYRARLAFRERIYGGIPKDPHILLEWLRKHLGVDDTEELRQRAMQIARERGLAIPEGATYEEVVLMAERLGELKGNGFRQNGDGVIIGGYQVKAALKESANIVFYGQRLGTYTRRNRTSGQDQETGGKIARSYLAERVWVDPDDIPLGREEPDGTHLVAGRVQTPQGERSTLNYYDYVTTPEISITVRSMADALTADQWEMIWVHAQENGIGSVRSLGHGRFDVVEWTRTD